MVSPTKTVIPRRSSPALEDRVEEALQIANLANENAQCASQSAEAANLDAKVASDYVENIDNVVGALFEKNQNLLGAWENPNGNCVAEILQSLMNVVGNLSTKVSALEAEVQHLRASTATSAQSKSNAVPFQPAGTSFASERKILPTPESHVVRETAYCKYVKATDSVTSSATPYVRSDGISEQISVSRREELHQIPIRDGSPSKLVETKLSGGHLMLTNATGSPNVDPTMLQPHSRNQAPPALSRGRVSTGSNGLRPFHRGRSQSPARVKAHPHTKIRGPIQPPPVLAPMPVPAGQQRASRVWGDVVAEWKDSHDFDTRTMATLVPLVLGGKMEVEGGSRTPQTDIDLTKEILLNIIAENIGDLAKFQANPPMLKKIFDEKYAARLMQQFPGAA